MTRALLSRRHLLAGAGAAALSAGAVGDAKADTGKGFQYGTAREPDPIFAAIDRVKATWDALGKACMASDQAMLAHGVDSVEYERGYLEQAPFCNQHNNALDALLSTVPTTIPGVLAYLDFLSHVAAFLDVSIESWQQEAIIGALKAAVLRYVNLPVSATPIEEAVPVTRELLENYDTWLLLEHRRLNAELANHGNIRVHIPGSDYHWRDDSPSPSTRAARVLAAVGCPLAWEA